MSTLRLLEYLVNSLWMASLIFAAAWLAARLAHRAGPDVEHRIWVGALLLEVVLPAVRLQPAVVQHALWSWLRWSFADQAAEKGGVAVSVSAGVVHGSLTMPKHWMLALAVLYGGIVLYFAARLTLGIWSTHRMQRRSHEALLSAAELGAWQRCCAHFGLVGVRVAVSQEIGGPVTVGLRRAALLLPPLFFERVDESDLDAVMAHECAHMQRHDFMKNLLYRIASLPIAYHPLLWLTLARVAESREMICDSMAANAVEGRQSYARSLLRLAAMMTAALPARTLHAIGIFDANTFERRVMRLTGRNIEMGRSLRLVTAAACVTLGAATCASALAMHTEIAASSSAADKKEASDTVKVAPGEMAGNAISQKKPAYPEDAKKAHVEGAVVLKAIISKEGNVENLQIMSGPEMLRHSAIDAVKDWKYKPYLLNSEPVEVETTVTVNYSIPK